MANPNQKSIRIFKSDLLETLTHVHPSVPLILWGPVVAGLVFLSLSADASVWTLLGFAGLGLLAWTAVEYLLHRFAFHYQAGSSFGKRIVFIMHGLHHDDPVDPTRLVMPPVPALIYAGTLFFLFQMILGLERAYPFFAGFLTGYLAYDYIHYYVHHFNPKNKIGVFLKKHHMLHHYDPNGSKWGVSSPLWDHIFGTYSSKSKKHHERSVSGASRS